MSTLSGEEAEDEVLCHGPLSANFKCLSYKTLCSSDRASLISK